MASVADDWLGRMFVDMAAKYGISVHHRKVAQSSLSFIMPKGGQRAIVRCRDDNFRHPFPMLNLAGCRALHVDGHLADAAIHYAKICHEAGILTSLDGGGLRSNTHELLAFIGAAVVAERLCEQMKLTPGEMLDLSALARLQDRRRHHGRARHALVRRDQDRAFHAGVERPRGQGHRHQRRRRHLSRRLHVFVSGRPGRRLGAAFQVRARGVVATPSSISATRRACRRWPRSTRPRRGSACGGRARSSSKWYRTHGARRRSRGPCSALRPLSICTGQRYRALAPLRGRAQQCAGDEYSSSAGRWTRAIAL